MLFLIESPEFDFYGLRVGSRRNRLAFRKRRNIGLDIERRRHRLARSQLWPSPTHDQPVNADRLGYIFDALLAEVFEFKRQLFHDVIVNAARDADTAWVSQPFQTRGDVYAVAENISVLQHDVADIDSDSKCIRRSFSRSLFERASSF